MKPFKACFYTCLIITLALTSCHTTEMVQGPDGSWYETGRQTTYPQFEVLRGRKDLDFPLDLQRQTIAYYEQFGIWPLSLESFKEASERNRKIINGLPAKGYQELLYLQRADTLFIYFKFIKQLKVTHHYADDGDIHSKAVPGVWKFYPNIDQQIISRQELYVKY